MRRRWRRIAVIILVVLGITLAGGLVWLNDLADPTAEATEAMTPGESVSVSTDGPIVFEPAIPATTGFIIYPGGRVAAEAYAPVARQIADKDAAQRNARRVAGIDGVAAKEAVDRYQKSFRSPEPNTSAFTIGITGGQSSGAAQ